MFISKAIRVFVTVYQEKNINAAAERLYLTVPPVTRMLKLTEEWDGGKLFTLKNNIMTPTKRGERLYRQVYPHYAALNSINSSREDKTFRIASDSINLTVVTDFLNSTLENVCEIVSLNNSESISHDDNMYISLTPVPVPPHFREFKTSASLSLLCASDIADNWKHQPCLIETSLQEISSVQDTLTRMHTDGYSGTLMPVDNTAYLQQACMKGNMALLPSRPGNVALTELPYQCSIALFIYVNDIKRNVLNNNIFSNLERMCHRNDNIVTH
ncbi:LysR family transcriptional regulator [Enterobacteriaceae bacterium 4M9]|nr:LysR family transcriptional regulator [Enterobacteriaceae bacterium 4M9]